MDFLQVLRGEAGSITQDQADALICAGLISIWPDQVLRLGPIAQRALFICIAGNDGAPITAEKCAHGASLLHEEAHNFAQSIQRPDATHTLLTWWANALTKRSASGIVRRPLPALIDDRAAATFANAGRKSRATRALELLGKQLDHLVLLDDASPKDGPAVWTMTYILQHQTGLTGLALEGREGLVARTTEFLHKSYETSYLYALAVHGPFLVSESVDAQKHINLDFSGVGGADPRSGWNLASTPGFIRGDECWLWPVGTLPDRESAIEVPLSLSIHLAVLALRRAAMPSNEKVPGDGNAVVVVGERKGWLYMQGVIVQSSISNPSDSWLSINDNGVLSFKSAGRLHDLIEDLPSAMHEPESGLRAASSLLGYRSHDGEEVPDPRVLRMRIRLRDDQSIPVINDLLNYINTCARSL